jgi:hydrogenase maturation protein HypF
MRLKEVRMKPDSLAQTLSTEVTEEIRARGTVQGVGFRPTVYRLAQECGLRGEVSNDGLGVLILVAGDRAAIDTFVQRLQQERPPLAKIESIDRRLSRGDRVFSDFAIVPSTPSAIHTKIVPDAATCPACKTETLDPFSRWYRYPFTNCTHCGPRLSLIQGLPYDRANTSMAKFALCADCQRDYEDPTNRRFHAQPTACHACGPKAWLERADGKPITDRMFSMLDDLDAVCTLLQQGKIVAIKGLGGFHLACDATNEEAVQKLRDRKHRPDKPLALMARDLEIIAQHCILSDAERELLQSPAAPIVLLRKKPPQENPSLQTQIHPPQSPPIEGGSPKSKIQNRIAPGLNVVGFMLPYTPLHHLILKRCDHPIVLTSGNLSEEPQCLDNQDAKQRLRGIADYFLFHDRDVVNRVDDSVVRHIPSPLGKGGQLQILRRARGYAPAPIDLPEGFNDTPPILAMGSELKNTFCLLREGQAILSQHLGDLENALASQAYRDTLNLYLHLFEHQPVAIAVDLHPEYLSTKLGQELAIANSLKLEMIQHHHAHVAACMADNGVPLDAPPVLGIALDGLGYGEDGTLWGGEFLLADYRRFQRLATFKPVPMMGGEQAIYQPWRNTYAHLRAAELPLAPDLRGEEREQNSGWELFSFLEKKPLKLLDRMVEKGINSPVASSCGRLFDAVAAAIGICRESCSYEGQGAMVLEALAEEYILNHPEETPAYPFALVSLKRESGNDPSPLFSIELRPMWEALLEDLQNNSERSVMAAKFHRGLADAIASLVVLLQDRSLFHQVALTGGVFQNCVLLELVRDRIAAMGLEVLTHSQVPPNDGGLSLGQAAIACAKQLSVNSER